MPHPLIERVRIAEAVAAKYWGVEFEWGRHDCAQLAHEVMVQMGRTSPVADFRYKTRRGSLKALHAAGYQGLDEAVDAMGFERIAPAMALPADLLAFPTIKGFGRALGLSMSNGLALTFVDSPLVGGFKAVVGKAALADFAWRVVPDALRQDPSALARDGRVI